MKTLQRVLCVMLSIIMAMSCLSVAAFAEGEEKFTSTIKAHSTMSNKETAKVTLDELDKLLAEADIYEEIVLTEGVIGDGIKLVIDLRSVMPECIYRGFCPEFRSCGYVDTPEYKEALEKYRSKT